MIAIDYQDRRPIYEQIVEKYELLIISGALEKDEKMPSVRQMAQELSINPNTIQKAYAILERDSYIYTVRGRGNFVSGNEAPARRKKKLWEEQFVQVIREGKELGIEAERILFLTKEVLGGTDND